MKRSVAIFVKPRPDTRRAPSLRPTIIDLFILLM